MDLKDFQARAVAELCDAMGVKGKRDIILESPTGSGKTIILTRFMSEYMRENKDVVFVWLTPGKGELEEQSKAKMDRYCHNAATKNLSDVMTAGFAAGDAVFINWEKLTKKGSNALKDSERTNFIEWIEKALGEGLKFKIVIDESHQNFTEKADAIVELFHTDKIVRASATPRKDPSAIRVAVTEEEVISEGLIKRLIQINPDFPAKIENVGGEGLTGYLLEKAMEKRNELRSRLAARGSKVNPLVVVQLPNDSGALLDEVEKWFSKRSIDVNAGTLAVWLAERHDNLEGITEIGAPQVAVVIKQAIATGWDCPRAHILVKLRHNMDETFEIQTIGRIRRMPEAKHYEDDALDSCYLYTFDEKFTAGVREKLGKNAFDAKKVFVKVAAKGVHLTKEQRTMVAGTRDEVLAFTAVKSHFAKEGFGIKGKAVNRRKMETKGYIFETSISGHSKSGATQSLAGVARREDFKDVGFRVELNTHLRGHEYHRAIGEIGKAGGLKYDEARRILNRLFAEDKECLVDSLTQRELAAFVINNLGLLKRAFCDAMAEELRGEGEKNHVSKRDFHIPQTWVCTYDASMRTQNVSAKNVYKEYPMSAAPRSKGERKFEKWCEDAADVQWVYRNGDKGDEYFSIVYEDNAGRQKLFYPDYIISVGGDVWIVEVKGGWNSSGASENIDIYAAKKADALNRYCKEYGLHGAFVCHDENEDALLASDKGYSEDVHANCWRLINEVIA